MKCTVEQKDRIVSERFHSFCDFVILSPNNPFMSAPGKTLIGYCKTDYIMWFFRKCQENPERLEWINQRLSQIQTLKRKYGDSIPHILAYLTQIKQQLILDFSL